MDVPELSADDPNRCPWHEYHWSGWSYCALPSDHAGDHKPVRECL